MAIDKCKPSPSDFANYVYCSLKWFYNFSSDRICNYINENLYLGQNNEHKCIEWVLNKYRFTKKQIMFDGTGKNNHNFLTSEIKNLSVNMYCQPDLIINVNNKILLFEFKAVKNSDYLLLPEFDSLHAQVWCYKNLREQQIDEFHILRYFIDPCMKIFSFKYTPSYRHRELTSLDLDTSKFNILFERYINAMKVLQLSEMNKKKIIQNKLKDLKFTEYVLSLFGPPNEYKTSKCNGCFYGRKNICNFSMKNY